MLCVIEKHQHKNGFQRPNSQKITNTDNDTTKPYSGPTKPTSKSP